MINTLKKYWKHIAGVLGIGIMVAFAAGVTPTTVTITSRTISGDFFSPSVTIPAGSSVTIATTMADAVYHDPSKSFSMSFQYSKDNGSTWSDLVGCSFIGQVNTITTPEGIVDPRPTCGTGFSNLTGQKMRLHINAPSAITLGATITIQ